MESELYKLNPWWERDFEEKSIEREKYLDALDRSLLQKRIVFLTGLRRVGKTTIMFQAIQRLLQKVVPADILFINLDTFSLLDASIHDMVSEYRRIHKKSVRDHFYLFLDEVASRENFEKELKSIYDNESISVVCTSSVATWMRDKRALLTGRTSTIEVMPLSFPEFLKFRGVLAKKSEKPILESHFRDYLRIGGIPHYVLYEEEEYLRELVESIIYKDIIAQYKITNEKVIKELFVLLASRVGKAMSYSRLANMLNISIDSVKRYIDYFEKAYLFYTIERHSGSYNEKIASPKKVYIGDVGIRNMVTGFRDLGASFENLVFLKIKDKRPSYYIDRSVEIDFAAGDMLIEAKYKSEMNEKQKRVFESARFRHKILARGVEFFLEG